MDISFRDKKLKKLVDDEKQLLRKYGKVQAKKIYQRLGELVAAKNLYDISRLPQARLHKLEGNLHGHFAVDILQPYRIIFKSQNDELIELVSITSVCISKIVDYH